ncbi:hypothetical protein PAXRUDRAFT_132034, partial [Paxillus rubicundulus Ve08.2h10]
LSTKNLTCLAELKMYVHEEHIQYDTVKKCHNDQEEGPASSSEGLGATTGRGPSKGISHITQTLIQVVDEEDQEPEYSAAEMSLDAQQYSPITIKELLDYSCAEAWLGSLWLEWKFTTVGISTTVYNIHPTLFYPSVSYTTV